MRWLIGATVLLPGCVVVVDDGGTGSEVVDETRLVEPFEGVVLNGRVDVEVTQADEPLVVVHCPAHLVANVETDVVNGDLVIGDRPEGLFASGWGQCWVEVGAPVISAVTINGSGDLSSAGLPGIQSALVNGSGDLTVDDLDGNTVDLTVRGSGDLRASGAVAFETLTLDGSGDLEAGDLHAVDAEVFSNGSGDVDVYATGDVTVHLSGSGDVRIGGDPTIDVQDNGSGDVILK